MKYEKGGLRKVYKKYKKGGVKKAAKYVGKSIYNRYTKGGLYQVARDVATLKTLVNVEKKYVENAYSNTVGQCLGNLRGDSFVDITPLPSQSVTYNGRTGQSIKLVSATIQLIINNQASQRVKQKIRFDIYYIKGDPKTVTAMQNELYDANPLTTIVDYMSNRNPNNFSDFRKICSRVVYYPEEPHSGSGAAARQKTLKINLKLDKHLRFDKNSQTLISGNIYIHAVTETGNCSPSTVVTTIPYTQNTAINTGFTVNMWTRFYYVDN